MDYRGCSPISGWGVRWNIDADYLQRLSDARDVSTFLYLFLLILSILICSCLLLLYYLDP